VESKRWPWRFQFFHCEPTIYLSVDTMSQSFYFLSGFQWRSYKARILSGKINPLLRIFTYNFDLVTECCCSIWPRIHSVHCCLKPVLHFSLRTLHLIFNMSNNTGVTSGVGIAYPSGASKFTPGVSWCFVCPSIYGI